MQYLNILYFLIITAVGYRFLYSGGKVMRGALNRDISYQYAGVETFWCLTFATGLLAFSLDVGLDLMALRLLVLEVFCLIGLSLSSDQPVFSGPLKIYAAFLIWLVIGIFYSPSFTYSIRVILKYLYPLLLCLFASSTVRDQEVFFKSSLLARSVALVGVALWFIPYIRILVPGVFWYGTASAINFISIMIFSLGMVFFTNKKKWNLFYVLLFLTPCFVSVFRTSIMGSGIAIMAFCVIKFRVKAVPYIVAVLAVGALCTFYVEPIKEKMFYDTSKVSFQDFIDGTIDENNFNTNTRSFMWERLEERLYESNELAGSGTGAVQNYMSNCGMEFGGLRVPHSDFVQQKCDNGQIGLVLYGCMILFVFVDCFRTYWNREYESYGALRLCAIVAGASLLGVYATFYSDNTVNYSMATLSMPFGFYGMMLGMRARYDGE